LSVQLFGMVFKLHPSSAAFVWTLPSDGQAFASRRSRSLTPSSVGWSGSRIGAGLREFEEIR
jgi:hypothetical protein